MCLVIFGGLALGRRTITTNEYLANGALVAIVGCILLLLGLANTSLSPRHFALMLPFAFIGIAQAVHFAKPAWRNTTHRRPRHRLVSGLLPAAVIPLIAFVLAAEHYGVLGAPMHEAGPKIAGPTSAARLFTVNTAAWAAAVGDVASNEVVICNDELACLLILGKVDYWLLTGRPNTGQYAQPCEMGECGYYGGAAIIRSIETLVSMMERRDLTQQYRILLMQTRKFPVADWRSLVRRLDSLHVKATIDQATNGLVMLKIGAYELH